MSGLTLDLVAAARQGITTFRHTVLGLYTGREVLDALADLMLEQQEEQARIVLRKNREIERLRDYRAFWRSRYIQASAANTAQAEEIAALQRSISRTDPFAWHRAFQL